MQLGGTRITHPPPNHNWGGMMAPLNFRSFFTGFPRGRCIYPIILVVETLFNGENFLVGEKDSSMSIVGVTLQEASAFQHPLLLQPCVKVMSSTSAISSKSKVLTKQPGHRSFWYVEFPRHDWLLPDRISVYLSRHCLLRRWSPYSSRSTFPWAILNRPGFSEPLDGPVNKQLTNL